MAGKKNVQKLKIWSGIGAFYSTGKRDECVRARSFFPIFVMCVTVQQLLEQTKAVVGVKDL